MQNNNSRNSNNNNSRSSERVFSGQELMKQLTDTQIQEFKDVFCLFDTSCDGELNIAEFTQMFQALGQENNQEGLQELIKDADRSQNGLISFAEFLNLATKMIYEEESVREAFEVLINHYGGDYGTSITNTASGTASSSSRSSSLDNNSELQTLDDKEQQPQQQQSKRNESGTIGAGAKISASAFKHAMTHMGAKFPEEELETMWRELELDENDDLLVDDFIEYCKLR
jgi:Ca2+-binding EF-hand superfamily protein